MSEHLTSGSNGAVEAGTNGVNTTPESTEDVKSQVVTVVPSVAPVPQVIESEQPEGGRDSQKAEERYQVQGLWQFDIFHDQLEGSVTLAQINAAIANFDDEQRERVMAMLPRIVVKQKPKSGKSQKKGGQKPHGKGRPQEGRSGQSRGNADRRQPAKRPAERSGRAPERGDRGRDSRQDVVIAKDFVPRIPYSELHQFGLYVDKQGYATRDQITAELAEMAKEKDVGANRAGVMGKLLQLEDAQEERANERLRFLTEKVNNIWRPKVLKDFANDIMTRLANEGLIQQHGKKYRANPQLSAGQELVGAYEARQRFLSDRQAKEIDPIKAHPRGGIVKENGALYAVVLEPGSAGWDSFTIAEEPKQVQCGEPAPELDTMMPYSARRIPRGMQELYEKACKTEVVTTTRRGVEQAVPQATEEAPAAPAAQKDFSVS